MVDREVHPSTISMMTLYNLMHASNMPKDVRDRKNN